MTWPMSLRLGLSRLPRNPGLRPVPQRGRARRGGGRRALVPITLKLATSLDGRIAMASGESRWITGEGARQAVHQLRSEHDAVLVGAETALADDPELTVRLPGYNGRQPARVVLDSRQRLSPVGKLATTARDIPTYVIATTEPDPGLIEAGVRVLRVRAVGEERPELKTVVEALAAEGLSRLF